jgi:Methyltransferase FkbM domain
MNVLDQTEQYRSSFVPCFPLESLLSAINQTRVDYFSLDVEGLELEVLETIPWSKFDIRTLSVEHAHVRRGGQAVSDFMAGKGYRKEAVLSSTDHVKNIFVEDIIFVKN